MMLAEVTVNLHYFGFCIKDIRINQMVFFLTIVNFQM
jgi:hypothetical protein